MIIIGQLGYYRSAAHSAVSIGQLSGTNFGNVVQILGPTIHGPVVIICCLTVLIDWFRLFGPRRVLRLGLGINLHKHDASNVITMTLRIACVCISASVSGRWISSTLYSMRRLSVVARWVTATAHFPPMNAAIDVASCCLRRRAGCSSSAYIFLGIHFHLRPG